MLALALLWWVVRDMDFAELQVRLAEVNYFWVGLSVVFACLSHLLRAFRWNLMLRSLGPEPGTYASFLSLMVGYTANLLVPRVGEVVRCGVLNRMKEIPVSRSLGTVLGERALDLIVLLSIVGVALLLQFAELKGFLAEIFAGGSRFSNANNLILLLGVAATVGIAGLLLLWFTRHRWGKWEVAIKIKSFLRELMAGLLSVTRLKEQKGFWLSTVGIWLLYYLMTYVIVFTLPATSGMSWAAGLAILAMGGIGMAAPVQGGIGTYHFLVSGVLMVYGASKPDAVFLALLLHTSQTIFMVIAGLISLAFSYRSYKASTSFSHAK